MGSGAWSKDDSLRKWLGDHALSILAVALVVGSEIWLGALTDPANDALLGLGLFATSSLLAGYVAFGPGLHRPWTRVVSILCLALLAAIAATLFVLWVLRSHPFDTVVLLLCVTLAAGVLLAPVAAWAKGEQYAALLRYGGGLVMAVVLGLLVIAFRAATDGIANDTLSWTLLAISLGLALAAGLVSRWRATPAWFVGFGVPAFAVAMLETSTLGWQTIGFVLLGATFLVAIARNATVTTLRLAAAVVAVATLVALVNVGGREEARGELDEACEELATLRPPATGGEVLTCGPRPELATHAIACDGAAGGLMALCDDKAAAERRLSANPRRDLLAIREAVLMEHGRLLGDAVATADGAAVALAAASAERGRSEDELAAAIEAGSPAPVVAARARLDADLTVEASARQAAEQATTVQADALAARDEARAAVDGDETDLATLASDGANEIVRQAMAPFVGSNVAARLGDVGWVILAVLVLILYRRLEIQSADRNVGPVSIEPFVLADQTEGDPRPQYLTQKMRDWLARADVFEPGTVPSSGDAEQLASVVADDVVKGGKVVGAAIRLFQRVAFPPSGCVVSPSYEVADDTHIVSVTLKSARRGVLIVSQRFDSTSADAAIAAAASFVGQRALGVSAVVPPWCSWPAEDGRALRRYVEAMDEGRKAVPSQERRCELLQAAVAANPASGLLRVEYGHQLAIADDPVEALLQHVAATVMSPRFLKARYRLGATLSMMSEQLGSHWTKADPDRRAAIARLLDQCHDGLARRRGHADLLRSGEATPAVRQAFVAVAVDQLKAGKRQLNLGGVALRALVHPRERKAWLDLLRSPKRRRQQAAQFESALVLAELRRHAPEHGVKGPQAAKLTKRIDAVTSDPETGMAALYNAACYHAVCAVLVGRDEQAGRLAADVAGRARDDAVRRAVEYLWRCERVPGSPGPSLAWIEKDPDLGSLVGNDDFEHFRLHLGLGMQSIMATNVARAAEASGDTVG